MNIKSMTLAATTLVLSTSVNAAIITHGALTTNDDGSTNIITDSLNNYEWLRFDVLADFTYAQTQAVLDTQDGGGWSITTVTQANMFTSALFAPSTPACSNANISDSCGTVSGWFSGDFGDSHVTGNTDIVFYLGDLAAVNYMIFNDSGSMSTTMWGSINDSDRFSADGDLADRAASWLLYRPVDAAVVPLPSAVWLFGSGFLGLVGLARRKKA
jgi:hypothetical protein